MDEILTILQEGELNRATAAHLLNEHSSRSHAILTIQVENEISLQNSQDPSEQITKLGKLIFVDLAGKLTYLHLNTFWKFDWSILNLKVVKRLK